jgi:hypothetical protein
MPIYETCQPILSNFRGKGKERKRKGDSCEEVSERLKRVWTTASIAFI